MIEHLEVGYQPTVNIPLGDEPVIPFANTQSADSVKAIPRYFQNLIVRKIHGRDVRVTVPVNPDGTTVFHHQPDKVVLLDTMLQHTDKGQRRFQDYPYDLLITKRELIRDYEDAIGSCRWLVRAQAVGNHYKNGIGNRIPKESSVNKNEDETAFYVSHSSTPYDPGRVYAQLLRFGTPEFVEAERQYLKACLDTDHMSRMKGIEQIVHDYRKRKNQAMLQGDVPLAAD